MKTKKPYQEIGTAEREVCPCTAVSDSNDLFRSDLVAKAREMYTILDATSPSDIDFLEAREPFHLLVSVILSAQTTDRQVNEIAPTLFSRYPKPADLAAAEHAEVAAIIRSTGYFNTKASNIIGAAKRLVEVYQGHVPLDMDSLLTLPGVGRKTASVMLGRIANQPAIIVDTHFARVVRKAGLTGNTEPDAIEQDIAALLPPENWYRFSMTVNLHGRRICHARKSQCEACPIAHLCTYHMLHTAV